MRINDLQGFREKVLYPCVRVRAASAGGSGQVVLANERDGTFVLTCQHVVDGCIEVKEEWSQLQQRNVKKDVLAPVDVEFFSYKYDDRAIGSTKVQSEIVCYDKNEDIALLRLEADPRAEQWVAAMFPCEGPKDPHVSEHIDYMAEVVTVGAAMGSRPITTTGNLCDFNEMIDNREYWLSTAPSIFGNSGGATFLTETWEFIGMPARITVSRAGFSSDAITHMGYIVPITRIVKFLKDNMMEFFFDDSTSYEECIEKIKRKREKAELEAMAAAMKGNSK